VLATGQKVHPLCAEVPQLRTDGGGIRHHPQTMQTDNPRWFVGGDCANGGSEVVHAVAEGKRAALGIHQWLEGRRG
jgi:glutamate synthase (NADPH/NADH) small chain